MRSCRHEGWLFCPTGVWAPGTIRMTSLTAAGERCGLLKFDVDGETLRQCEGEEPYRAEA